MYDFEIEINTFVLRYFELETMNDLTHSILSDEFLIRSLETPFSLEGKTKIPAPKWFQFKQIIRFLLIR